jgi:negative regulator of flagellin synthesis FlgM
MRVSQSGNNPITEKDLSSAAKTEKGAQVRGKRIDTKEQAQNTDQVGGTPGAKTEISGRAKEMAKAMEVASSTPDVREDKIAELKRRISAGKYNVDADAIADKMVDEHIKTSHLG